MKEGRGGKMDDDYIKNEIVDLKKKVEKQGDKVEHIEIMMGKILVSLTGNGTKGLAERVDTLEDNMDKLSSRITKIFIVGIALGVVALLLTGKVEWIFTRLF